MEESSNLHEDMQPTLHMDELLARHKKEQRDLVATMTSLKKQASKKTRKAVNQKCTDMQAELDARHKRELSSMNGDVADEEEEPEVTPELLLATLNLDKAPEPETGVNLLSLPISQPSQAPRRRNRAKERLAKRQAQEDAVRAAAREEAANLVDYKKIEEELMAKVLEKHNLRVYDIQPDGHCLFRSLQDQLRSRMDRDVSIQQLRSEAAAYIRSHADDFTPYLFDEDTMSVRDVTDYTRELEDTAMWGSDMELLALSRVYGCPIQVFVAGSAPILFNEDADGCTLQVAFYKHSYGLGEHYNSCRDSVFDDSICVVNLHN